MRGRSPQLRPLLLRDVLATLDNAVRPGLPPATTLTLTPIDDTLCINGCADELVGALSNLITNAVDVGGDAVRVDVWAGATSSDWLQISVRDNGPGIAADALPRLFDPFFTTRAGGTGLGLAVVAMTVAQHGGRVRARNRAGGGAEFLIDLPLCTDGAAPQRAPQTQRNKEHAR